MFYISVDLETTGLNSENCQILSFGAVIEDTKKKLPFKEIPKFYAIILREQIIGEPFALNMNKDLISLIAEYMNGDKEKKEALQEVEGLFLREEALAAHFLRFLEDNGFIYDNKPVKINVAGKNFGTFDLKFLVKVPRWKQYFSVNQRILDPAMSFVDWENDEQLPNLSQCKLRANIDGKVSHNALEDAWDVVSVLRKKY
jgi:oligoribonuclease